MTEEQTPAVLEVGDTSARLARLQGQIAAAERSVDVDATERAERLVVLEAELAQIAAEIDDAQPGLLAARGHPVLAEASAWREEIVEQELSAPAGETAALVESLVQDEVTAFRERIAPILESGDPRELAAALTEASALEREALDRLGEPHRLGGLEAPRRELREKFAAVASHLGEADRELFTRELCDRAAVVLTGVDHLPPAQATIHLSLAAEDLEWHLAHIETGRGRRRRRLSRKRRRLRDEESERDLQARLELRYSKPRVAFVERLVLWLVFLVLAILAVEVMFDLPRNVRIALAIVDTAACVVFLAEFFAKLRLVQGRGRWFLRHMLIDLLPSIPFGILVLGQVGADPTRAARAVRLARITRVARYVRLLLPIIRLIRAFGFLARGLDRLAARHGHLLNRNIVLYPTREERRLAAARRAGPAQAVRRSRAELAEAFGELLRGAPDDQRAAVAQVRTQGLARLRESGLTQRPQIGTHTGSVIEDVPAEALIDSLAEMTPARLEAEAGPDFVQRSARAVRMFSRAPIRWFPVIRRYVPRLSPEMNDAEVTSAACHSSAKELRRHHDRWFWFADLYGTVTPSEFVDRVGSAMVKGAFRPAYRLTLFGGFFLLVRLLLDLLGNRVPLLQQLHDKLDTFVGIPLITLGTICAAVLGVGWWFKRIAGEATFLYERAVKAQFLALMECIKGRAVDRDTQLLDLRVLAPEAAMLGGADMPASDARRAAFERTVRSWLIEAQVGGLDGELAEAYERVVLLYRDGLDGALFTDTDTRTTSQLLGNPALRELRSLSGRVTRKEQKLLRKLDLDRPRAAFGGPYLWFSYIAKAISHSAARRILEYNQNAVPLDEVPWLADDERERYERWLGAADSERSKSTSTDESAGSITTAFTALHFLDDDPRRDQEIADRFGETVLEKLQVDRRLIFRKVFGTYPLHMRPKEQRVLNLHRVYDRWFARGRAFFIPLRLGWRGLVMTGRFIRWIARALREIMDPSLRSGAHEASHADFDAARRKIGRMRGPILWACLWMRARFDVEYLGFAVPGTDVESAERAPVDEDLRFLDAEPEQVEQLDAERDRAEWDMRRLNRLLDDGLLSRLATAMAVREEHFEPEHMRALAAAYHADFQGVRVLLSCHEILVETRVESRRQPLHPPRLWPPALWKAFRLRGPFKRWWRLNGRGGAWAKKAMWRALAHDIGESRRALLVWARRGTADAFGDGVARLSRLLRHPGRISEQILTLRTVQSLSLIDLLNYRQHVYRLGAYAASGDVADDWLTLDGVQAERPPSTGSV